MEDNNVSIVANGMSKFDPISGEIREPGGVLIKNYTLARGPRCVG